MINRKAVLVILAALMGWCIFATPSFSQEKDETILRVGVIPLVEHIPILLAQNELAASGVSKTKVVLDIYTSWTGLEAAFRTGAIDMAAITLPKALLMSYEGISLKIMLVVNRNGSAVVLKGGDSAKDLMGKITGGDGNDTMDLIVFSRFLKDRKLKLGYEVRSLLVPFNKGISLLKEDRLYGFCFPEPYGALAEKEGVAKKMFLSKDIYPNHVGSVLIVNPNALKTHGDTIKVFIKSVIKQSAVIEKNKQESQGKQTAMAQVNIFKIEPGIVGKVLTTPTDRILFKDLTPTVKEADEVMKALMSLGILSGNVNLKDIIDTRYCE